MRSARKGGFPLPIVSTMQPTTWSGRTAGSDRALFSDEWSATDSGTDRDERIFHDAARVAGDGKTRGDRECICTARGSGIAGDGHVS